MKTSIYPMSFLCLFLFVLIFSAYVNAQTPVTKESNGAIVVQKISKYKLGDSAYRSIAVVDDNVVWVAGSHNRFCLTRDGGEIWKTGTICRDKQLDFRSIVALDHKTAIVISAGSPTRIYRTDNSGEHWTKCYETKNNRVFINSLIMNRKQEGLAFGDPVDNHFFILKTSDGFDWDVLKVNARPPAFPGEAGYAASASSMISLDSQTVLFGSGGSKARIFRTEDFGKSWQIIDVPILSGKQGDGIYSIAFNGKESLIAVGGNWLKPWKSEKNAIYSIDKGKTWASAVKFPGGFRQCVSFWPGSQTAICVNIDGAELTIDGGEKWNSINIRGFYTCRVSDSGKTVWFAGPKGAVGRMDEKHLKRSLIPN